MPSQNFAIAKDEPPRIFLRWKRRKDEVEIFGDGKLIARLPLLTEESRHWEIPLKCGRLLKIRHRGAGFRRAGFEVTINDLHLADSMKGSLEGYRAVASGFRMLSIVNIIVCGIWFMGLAFFSAAVLMLNTDRMDPYFFLWLALLLATLVLLVLADRTDKHLRWAGIAGATLLIGLALAGAILVANGTFSILVAPVFAGVWFVGGLSCFFMLPRSERMAEEAALAKEMDGVPIEVADSPE